MNSVMLKGEVVTAIVAAVAMAGVVGAFASNASPYVTVAQARRTGGDALHLSGVLDKSSVRTDFSSGHLFFDLKDSEGATMAVEYTGERPNNLMEADKVVAIGSVHGERFVSRKLLLKCPSKYETKNPQPLAARL